MWEKNMWFHISVNILKACFRGLVKRTKQFWEWKCDQTHGLKVTVLGAVHLHSSSDLLTSCVNLISFTNPVSCVHGAVTIECLHLSSQWLLNGSDWSVDFSLLCTETLRWPEMTDAVRRFGCSVRVMPLWGAEELHTLAVRRNAKGLGFIKVLHSWSQFELFDR